MKGIQIRKEEVKIFIHKEHDHLFGKSSESYEKVTGTDYEASKDTEYKIV